MRTSYAYPVQSALFVNESGRIEMFQSAEFNTRSQDFPEALPDAGQIYWRTADAWRAERAIFSKNSVPAVLPRHRVQDIDTLKDRIRAEWLFGAMRATSRPT